MTYRPKGIDERIMHRLKISRGHLEKVIQMVENDDYCIDILTQSLAVQGALKEIDSLLLENHLNTCVVDDIKKGKTKETVEEILKVFKKI